MSTSPSAKRPSAKRPSGTVPLNFRIKPAVRNMIDRAAELVGKTRTDFMIDASEQRAADILMDRATLSVDQAAYDAFLAQLDAPPAPNERLRRTMSGKAPWDAT